MAQFNIIAPLVVVLLVLLDGTNGSGRGLVSSQRRGGGGISAEDGLCSWVIKKGYKCQEFQVKTGDGYILSLNRIPQGRAESGEKNKQPVLLQHGLLVDGMTWMINSVDESLAFILADNDFDVWIANTRGTRFSRKHATIQDNDPAYWHWSWDELVEYELPAIVDFVYGQTGQKMQYVGHSMGSLVALASFSQGKLVDKVKSAALLSPVAYLSHMTTALGVLAAKSFVGELTIAFGLAEFNPKGPEVSIFLGALCANPKINCYDLVTAITGHNCCMNRSTVDLFLQNEPQPTSTRNMVHLAQTVRSGVLRKYNFGDSSFNTAHYGQSDPPVYNLPNIPKDFPLFLSYGGQDALADPSDVGTILDALKQHDPNKITVQFLKNYAHADFIMGVSANNVVYNALISFFKGH